MAEESVFDSAMASLKKPQETRRLLKILVALRKEMEWPKHQWNMLKFYDTGCIKPLFGAMQRDNGSVLDVCLSILGNCAMDAYIAKNLVKVHNILPILSKLLMQHKESDGVNGRIFRIVGNICRHWGRLAPAIFDQEPELVKHIVDYLKNSAAGDNNFSSSATVNMGIRALRELTNRDTVTSLVTNFEVLQTVGLVLIKYSAKWLEEKRYETLLLNIVRILYSYTCYKHPRSIGFLKNTGSGDSLRCLSVIIPLAPGEIVDIVMNLVVTTSLKSDLPVPEICEALQKLIRDQVDKNKGDPLLKQHLKSLCVLFTHPGNRPDDRNKGSIPFLIQILRELNLHAAYLALAEDSSQDKNKPAYHSLITQLDCCITIIMTLQMCMYDESLVALQVKHDIIDILVEKLEWVTGTSNSLNLKHDVSLMPGWAKNVAPVKRRRLTFGECVQSIDDATATTSAVESSFNLWALVSSGDDIGRSFSDKSCYSDRASSLSSSETTSFYFDSDDDYSPVCSECEDNVEEETKEIKKLLDEEIEKLPEESGGTSKEIPVFKDKKLTTVQHNLLHAVVGLLRWFSKVRSAIPQMGTLRVLKALLNSTRGISLNSNSDSINIVMEILEYQEYMVPLLQTDFVPMVYELLVMQHRRCLICQEYQQMGLLIIRRLTILAQSGCGRGDIAHQLMRGSDTTKRKLVLALPYVIRNKYILSNFMITCGGLEVLMKILQENSEYHKRSIQALCMLAMKKLRIKNPKDTIGAAATKEIHLPTDYTPPESSEKIVTFIFDDGATVAVDRKYLSGKSDYFSALLYGHFMESQQDMIALRHVNGRTFKSLLNLLNCDVKSSVLLKVDADLGSLLDLIQLADMFLLVDLCSRLSECVEKFHMSTKTVSRIYAWSVESGTDILRVETVAYALVANICDIERFLMFKDLFDLGCSKQLVEDIQKLLARFLNISVFCEVANVKYYYIED